MVRSAVNNLAFLILFGLKGLGIYAVLYVIKNRTVDLDFFEFSLAYSKFLILVPLLNFGMSSYILRLKFSKSRQQAVLSASYGISISAILASLLAASYAVETSLVVAWASLRSLFQNVEAFLISRQRELSLRLLYIYSIGCLFGLSLAIWSEKLNSVPSILLCLLAIESILIVIVPVFALRKMSLINLQSKTFKKNLRLFTGPIVVISIIMAVYLNGDKMIISYLGYGNVAANYSFLFFCYFAIHRFVTTPLVMRWSSPYYNSRTTNMPIKIWLSGLGVIAFICMILTISLEKLEPDAFSISLSAAFSLLVIALYFINLQMLKFKKENAVDVFAKIAIPCTLASLFAFGLSLFFFGIEYVDYAIVLGAAFFTLAVSIKEPVFGRYGHLIQLVLVLTYLVGR